MNSMSSLRSLGRAQIPLSMVAIRPMQTMGTKIKPERVQGYISPSRVSRSVLNITQIQVRAYSSRTGSDDYRTPPPEWDESGIFRTTILAGSILFSAYVLFNTSYDHHKIDDSEMKRLIRNMVWCGDCEAIIKLIILLRDNKNFPQIKDCYKWELVIRDVLIYNEDPKMIRAIFPYFCEQTLSYSQEYYKPIKNGNLELVKAMHDGGMLLSKDNDFSNKDNDVFLYSIYQKQLEIAAYLIEHGGYDINIPYPFTLRYAEERAEDKFKKGQHGSSDCITPAYLAVAMNDPALLKTLIAGGANCSLPNKKLNHHALSYWNIDNVKDNPLIYSIKNDRRECFGLLLELNDIDLNFQGALGRTALLVATWAKKFEMALRLVERGVDVNQGDLHDLTPIMFAISGGDLPLINALLQKGVIMRCKDSNNRNLWEFASRCPNPSEVCAILRANIPDMIDDESDFGSPLLDAVDAFRSDSVEALLKSGASTTKTQNIGDYKRKGINLSSEKEVNIYEYAQAKLSSLHEESVDPQYVDERIRKVNVMKEIVSILKNPPNTNKLEHN